MNSKNKTLRIIGGIAILLNIILFFLPVAKYEQENYPVETYSQMDYVAKVSTEDAPYEMPATTGRLVWMFTLILLPFFLSLMAGIWGMVGSERQIVSSILIFITLGLYIALFCSLKSYFPDGGYYSRDVSGIGNLICSTAASILALVTVLYKGQEEEEPIIVEIPHVQDLKQEQIQSRYSILAEDEKKPSSEPPSPVIPPYVPGVPKGVMVGLTGIYAGAEISFRDGESIRLGRLPNNDLVFEGQDKVSRNHCYIKWNGREQKFFIKDFSSNGTFVNGAEDCLPQNIEIEIPIGSVIAIGDEKNTFRLE